VIDSIGPPLRDPHHQAVGPRVALVTCAELPELDPDDRHLLKPLADLGVDVCITVWDDPSINWESFDLVLLRSTWDYPRRRNAFVAWASSVPRLANPADVVEWNTDKRYLRDLAAAGVPIVHTEWVVPGEAWTAPVSGEWVVKPAVSAGSIDTGRYDCSSPEQRALAAAHVMRLQSAGRLVMVQPYISSVDTYGETTVLYLGGEYSHAIRKGPMLRGPYKGVNGLFVEEQVTARQPSEAELALAADVLTVVPGGPQRLLYARVDLLLTDAGPVVVELELTEPSLFLGTAPGSADRLAALVGTAARAGVLPSR
jgi:hypothetical protein